MSQISLPGCLYADGSYHSFAGQLQISEDGSKSWDLYQFYYAHFPAVKSVRKNTDMELQKQGVDTIMIQENAKETYFDEKLRDKDYGDILLEEFSIWPDGPLSVSQGALVQHLSWRALRELCLHLGVKDDILSNRSKQGAIRRLITYHRGDTWQDSLAEAIESRLMDIEVRRLGKNERMPNWQGLGLVPGWIGGKKITDYITYVVKPARRVHFLPFLLLQRAWIAHYRDWLGRYGRSLAPNRTYATSNIPLPPDVLYRALYEEAKWPERIR